ncbi:DUF6480 family protein [Streptomyces carpinensis]|uniref:DUF6480 family protein n=1 Tax=Streptomyces carpinensis TaxID=66369 RepID=A0ABV1W3Q8_9ACTN
MAGNHEELPDEGLSIPEDHQMTAGAAPPAESGVSELGPPQAAPRRGWRPTPLTPVLAVFVMVLLLVVALAIFQAVR